MNDDVNYVEPDISVICDLSKLDDKGCHGAPDWVIEIVLAVQNIVQYIDNTMDVEYTISKGEWLYDSN